jgi:hypothetical protein
MGLRLIKPAEALLFSTGADREAFCRYRNPETDVLGSL